MNTYLIAALVTGAFFLGACPFSFWIGTFALHKDIRKYGDGNPGSTNVFKAGGRGWGIAAVILDISKGMPFIVLGKGLFTLGQPHLYVIALAAILGHAYSPFLGFRGGKALATFGGTLFALGRWDIVISMVLIMFIGFLFIGNDSWSTMISITGTLCLLLLSHKDLWEVIFITCVTLVFFMKNYYDLKLGNPPGRLISWVRSKKKSA